MALSPASGSPAWAARPASRQPGPEHAPFGDDRLTLGLRAEDEVIGSDDPLLAQEGKPVRPQPLLVADEGERHLAVARPTGLGDPLGEPELDRHRRLAVAGAEPVQPAVDFGGGERIGTPVRPLADIDRVGMGVEDQRRPALSHPSDGVGDAFRARQRFRRIAGGRKPVRRVGADRRRVAGRVGGGDGDQVAQYRLDGVGYPFALHGTTD